MQCPEMLYRNKVLKTCKFYKVDTFYKVKYYVIWQPREARR
jgi:hypothetical protein